MWNMMKKIAAAWLISAVCLTGSCSKSSTQTVGGKDKEEVIAFAKAVCEAARDAKPRDFIRMAGNPRDRELKGHYDYLQKIRIADRPEWKVESNLEDADDYFVFFNISEGRKITMEIYKDKDGKLKFSSVMD